jgi:hypothetical protein
MLEGGEKVLNPIAEVSRNRGKGLPFYATKARRIRAYIVQHK